MNAPTKKPFAFQYEVENSNIIIPETPVEELASVIQVIATPSPVSIDKPPSPPLLPINNITTPPKINEQLNSNTPHTNNYINRTIKSNKVKIFSDEEDSDEEPPTKRRKTINGIGKWTVVEHSTQTQIGDLNKNKDDEEEKEQQMNGTPITPTQLVSSDDEIDQDTQMKHINGNSNVLKAPAERTFTFSDTLTKKNNKRKKTS